MYIATTRVKHLIKQAQKHAAKYYEKVFGTSFILVGSPGSQKKLLLETFLELEKTTSAHTSIHQKLLLVTDRTYRKNEVVKDNNEYLFSKHLLIKNIFLSHLYRLFKDMEDNVPVWRKAIYSIGSTCYSISFVLFLNLVRSNKKFAVITSVSCALALKKLLGNDVHIFVLDDTFKKCRLNLENRHRNESEKIRRKNIKAELSFGRNEKKLIKRYASEFTFLSSDVSLNENAEIIQSIVSIKQIGALKLVSA